MRTTVPAGSTASSTRAPASSVLIIPIWAVAFGDAERVEKVRLRHVDLQHARCPPGLRVSEKVIVSGSVLKPCVRIVRPPGAAGCVEIWSWLTSVNA